MEEEKEQLKLAYLNYVTTKPLRENARLIVYCFVGLMCARFFASVFTKPLKLRNIIRLPLIPFVYLVALLISKLSSKELAK